MSLFPAPAHPVMGKCRDCGTPARLSRMVAGLGEKCARDAGLIGRAVDIGQTGPDLFHPHKEDDLDGPDDHCDG